MNGTWNRRRVLGAGVAGSVVAGLGLGGCAAPEGRPLARVVVVGGGFGGATAARYLKMWEPALQVTLVDRQAQFVSCPMSNLVLEGASQLSDISRGYGPLEALGVRRVQAEVAEIDAVKKQVVLTDGRRLDYDRLVLSPGVDFMNDQVAGLSAASAQVLHAWKAGPQTVALRAQLQAMPDGGVFALTVPKAPYRCPPGPYERACMVASYFKKHKPRSKVLVLDANPEIVSKKGLFEQAFKQHYSGLIEYRPNSEVKEVQVQGSARTAVLEFDTVKADVLNVLPPMRAGDIAVKAGVVNVNARWAGVNWLTLESLAVPGIHVLGDATFSAPLMPKSGHMANQHAKVAAAAIIALLKGETVNPNPVVMNTCYSFVTEQEVVHVASVHQYDPSEKTFKTVPGSGGVSAAASALEGVYAKSWARNIWADMLG